MVADHGWLRPVDLLVLLRFLVLGNIVSAGKDDFVIGRDGAFGALREPLRHLLRGRVVECRQRAEDAARRLARGVHRQLIVESAARHRLPAIYFSRIFTEIGGLLRSGS